MSSHVLRKISPLLSRHRCGSRAQLATSPSAWSWFPAVPRVVHFCTSLGKPRSSVRKLCSAPLFGLGFRDRALVCSGSSCYRFGLPGRAPCQSFLECDQHSFLPQLSPQRACGYVPRGQWALLDADMPKLIDRSACLVEPVVVESLWLLPCLCCPRTEHVQRRVRSLRSRLYPIARPC